MELCLYDKEVENSKQKKTTVTRHLQSGLELKDELLNEILKEESVLTIYTILHRVIYHYLTTIIEI